MNFALGLEIRDSLNVISNAVVSTTVHADLMVGYNILCKGCITHPQRSLD
jgi:hypothetical protein